MTSSRNFLQSCTGLGIKIAVIDSGVNPGHPHVVSISGGIGISPDGEINGDFMDRNGHGTAVTGVIREKAPDASIYSIKIFDRRLTTRTANMIKAIELAIENGMNIINLSLGTRNSSHAEKLSEMVRLANRKNIAIVSALEVNGANLFPGCLPGVLAVVGDQDIKRNVYQTEVRNGEEVFVASLYPRDAPGLTKDQNLSGISFAVANMTGFVAIMREAHPMLPIAKLKRFLVNFAEAIDVTKDASLCARKL